MSFENETTLRILLGLFFLSPFLVWLMRIEHWNLPDSSWLIPLAVSIEQAGLSAAGSLGLGILMVLGALSLKSDRARKFLEYWLLLPNLIPQLFLLLAILNLSAWLPILHGGLPAVIIAHVFLNSGLVALALLRGLSDRVGGSLDLAIIEGASRLMIWREVILPSLRNELFFLFLFVFSVCLTSFAIPLVLGGTTITNFEILIYETLRISGDWSLAVFYAFVQMMILFIFAIMIPKQSFALSLSPSRWRNLGFIWLLPLTFIPTMLLVSGWLTGVLQSLMHFSPEQIASADVVQAALGTFVVSMGVGLLTVILCLWISFVWPNRGLAFFMKGYLTPSSAITGFALLLIPTENDSWTFVKMIVALTLVSFPLLFRWTGQAALESLQEQLVIARSLGASWSQILFEIIWPQRAGVFFRMAGLGSLWACGDFALSSIIAEGDRTWALWIASLIDSYRLDLASLLTVPLFAMGLLSYGLFAGAARYVSR